MAIHAQAEAAHRREAVELLLDLARLFGAGNHVSQIADGAGEVAARAKSPASLPQKSDAG